jgi:hypothetical protein
MKLISNESLRDFESTKIRVCPIKTQTSPEMSSKTGLNLGPSVSNGAATLKISYLRKEKVCTIFKCTLNNIFSSKELLRPTRGKVCHFYNTSAGPAKTK